MLSFRFGIEEAKRGRFPYHAVGEGNRNVSPVGVVGARTDWRLGITAIGSNVAGPTAS
jgi:hypothetical protein